MSIIFEGNNNIVHIKNKSISYIMEVIDRKYLVHRYFGKSIRKYRGAGAPLYFKRSYNTEHILSIEHISFDDVPFEYPVRGHGDYRILALSVIQKTGIDFIEPLFKEWKVLDKKPEIKGLKSTITTKYNIETLDKTCEE